MKKYLITGLIIVSIYISGVAQTTPPAPANSTPSYSFDRNKKDFSSQMFLTDGMGNAFKPYYHLVQGSPYLFESWSEASFTLKNGMTSNLFLLKLDIHDQQIYCLSTKNESLQINTELVQEFTIKDSSASNSQLVKFRLGYPRVAKQNVVSFYEVLADGKIQLLRFSVKKIQTEKNDFSGEVSKEFVLYDYYYVYVNGEMKTMKRVKDFFSELMDDKRDLTEEYIKVNKVSFKNVTHIAKLIAYYNTLD